MKKILLSIICLLCCNVSMMSENIYVSTTGNNNADGTVAAPLQTIDCALKLAREWRRLGMKEVEDGINIIVEGGTYNLIKPLFIRPEDSGTESSPTIIRGKDGETVVISGGIEISGWHKGTTDTRVPVALRNKIWVTDAPPMVGNRILETRQLWVNGTKAMRASQFSMDVMERMKDFNTEDQSITIPTPKQDLSRASQLEMLVHQRWATAILRVREMKDLGDGYTKVWFYDPESSIEFAHPWPQPVINGERGNSAFCLGNALELVDEPGEWYQDYPSGLIYYYPHEDEDMSMAQIVAPVLETLVEIGGTRERGVSYVSFENISFEHSSWLRPSHEGNVTLQGGFRFIDGYKLQTPGLFHKAELENQAWIARPEAALKAQFATNITFKNCNFSHIGATALDLNYAVSESDVTGCTMYDIGGTAILVGSFGEQGFETHIPYIPNIEDDLCHDITISGNNINNAANEDWGCVAVGAGYVRDISIVQNKVSNVSYSGICVGWGWTSLESGMRNNRIMENTVTDYAKRMYDAGGIYTLSNQPNSVISGNSIGLPYAAPYATNNRAFCIYFDEATDGFTVEHNGCSIEMFGYNKPGPNMVIKE